MKTAAGTRGVAALGRIEPYGGIVRVAAASTPDAMSGAILSKLLVDRGADVTAGQLLAEVDTAALARSRIVEAKAELETAKRDATASVSLADEACVLADVAAKRSKRKQDLLAAVSPRARTPSRPRATPMPATLPARRDVPRPAWRSHASVRPPRAWHASRPNSSARSSAHPLPAVSSTSCADPAKSWAWRAFSSSHASTRCRRSLKSSRPTSAACEWASARWCAARRLTKDLAGTVTRIRPKVQKIDQIGDDPVARKDARIVEVEIKLDDGRAAANLTNLQVEVEIGR